jgi:hypothetical protein
MSDTDFDADSISDLSTFHDGGTDGHEEAEISFGTRDLCNQLRANDPLVYGRNSTFRPSNYIKSDVDWIEVFQALKENTSVKHIDLILFSENYKERSALIAAEYVESSKSLQTLNLSIGPHCQYFPKEYQITSCLLLRALSRNKSVRSLIINDVLVRIASVAFRELLTCTQTLQHLKVIGSRFDEVRISTIASGFANNTTLRYLQLDTWQQADLPPVLTALQCHPTLKKIYLSSGCSPMLPSLSGLEGLLRSKDSKIKDVILEQVKSSSVGLIPVIEELRRNGTVISLAILRSQLTHEDIQQLKHVLRQNTTMQYLFLRCNRLGSAGLAEIASGLYRNTSIKSLDLSWNGIDNVGSANKLCELIRRNKTITSLCLSDNAFGRSATAARSIAEGVRGNSALQQLDLVRCELDDQGISVLANALATRSASIKELDLRSNRITSVGIRALVDDNLEAMATLTKLCLTRNPIGSEGATILADALGRNALPSLKLLILDNCNIEDDGLVALVSALEKNTGLQIISCLPGYGHSQSNDFGGERGFMALAESLPNIKGLQEINLTANTSFHSISPLLLEGFRKNTSLVRVNIKGWSRSEQSQQEMNILGQRNQFTPLLKASDPLGASPRFGIWSRALAKVATEPDILFHVLRNKPKLVGSSRKRRRGED